MEERIAPSARTVHSSTDRIEVPGFAVIRRAGR
jgi:hypothetical protein